MGKAQRLPSKSLFKNFGELEHKIQVQCDASTVGDDSREGPCHVLVTTQPPTVEHREISEHLMLPCADKPHGDACFLLGVRPVLDRSPTRLTSASQRIYGAFLKVDDKNLMQQCSPSITCTSSTAPASDTSYLLLLLLRDAARSHHSALS